MVLFRILLLCVMILVMTNAFFKSIQITPAQSSNAV